MSNQHLRGPTTVTTAERRSDEVVRTDQLRASDLGLGPVRFTFGMTPPLEHDVAVVRWQGDEALSELYAFEIEVSGDHADFVLDERLEKPATLSMMHGPHSRQIHGIVSRIQHLSGVHDAVHTIFAIVPELWLLTQHQRCRIYQELTTPEIVDQVLATVGAYGRRVHWRLTHPEAYQRRTYCVQYRESDYQFIARLLEDEGIHFFFEHPADGPEHIVFCDSNQLRPIQEPAEVDYREDTALQHDREHVLHLGLVAEARPTATALRDFNPLQPRLDLETVANGNASAREIYDYPGGYSQRTDGRRRVQARLEALRANTVRGRGEAVVTRFLPGHTFALTGHPRFDFDQSYVLWSVSHRARADETTEQEGSVIHEGDSRRPRHRYSCSFECTPAPLPIRPAIRTPRPRMYGSQTATVVGPASEEIYVDLHGRIKVQFHWDRDGQRDEHSSCWVRVAQTWASAGWGALVIPRIGMEVVVDFLEGDPDQPLVTGCVYNGTHPPPNSLPAEKTRSSFKTNSSPGGGGFNELTFEDAAGNEKIYVHAQKDYEEMVLHDHSTTVLNDQSNHVVNCQTENVDVNQSMTVGSNRTKTIGVNETNSIGANQSVVVGVNQSISVGANRIKTVGANETNSIGANQSTTVGGNRTEVVNGNNTETILGNQTVTIVGHRTRNMNAMEANNVSSGRVSMVKKFDATMVMGASATQVIGQWVVSALTGANLQVLASSLSMKPTKVTVSAPSMVTLKSGSATIELSPGKIVLDSGGGASIELSGSDVKINGTKIAVEAGGETAIKGAPVKINC